MFNRIRKYSLRDKDSIRKICLDNANLPERDNNTLSATLLMYCDCYLENESGTCFVAVDEKDEVIGYLLCAPDYERFSEVYNRDYLPKAFEYGTKAYVDAKMNMMSYAMYKTMYPAHFLLNVEKAYQRQGIGTKLVEMMKKDLLTKTINDVITIVREDDEAGIAFCEKNGFRRKMQTKLGLTYAKELDL